MAGGSSAGHGKVTKAELTGKRMDAQAVRLRASPRLREAAAKFPASEVKKLFKQFHDFHVKGGEKNPHLEAFRGTRTTMHETVGDWDLVDALVADAGITEDGE